MGSRIGRRLDRLLTPERLLTYPTTMLTMFGVFWAIQVMRTPSGLLPDFRARWTAGAMVVGGHAAKLYDPLAQWNIQRSHGATSLSWFVSPPPVAVLFTPFGALPYPIAALMWTAVSTAGFVTVALLLRPYWRESWRPYWGAVLIAIASQPMLELVGSGQDSWLILLAGVSAWRLSQAHRSFWAGVVLSVGFIVKPQLMLAVVILVLAYGGVRMLLGIAVGALSFVGTSLAIIGPETWVSWIHTVSSPAFGDQVTLGQAYKAASLQGFVIAAAPTSLARVAAEIGLVAGILLFVIWSTWLIRFRPTQWIALSSGACVTVLAAPHAMVYDLAIVLPAIAAVVVLERSRSVRVAAALGFITVWLGPLFSSLRSTPWPLSAVSAQWVVLIPLGLTIRLMTRRQTSIEGRPVGIALQKNKTRLLGISEHGRVT